MPRCQLKPRTTVQLDRIGQRFARNGATRPVRLSDAKATEQLVSIGQRLTCIEATKAVGSAEPIGCSAARPSCRKAAKQLGSRGPSRVGKPITEAVTGGEKEAPKRWTWRVHCGHLCDSPVAMGHYLPRVRFCFVYALCEDAEYRSREVEEHIRIVDSRRTPGELGQWN